MNDGQRLAFRIALRADRLFKAGNFRSALDRYLTALKGGCRHSAVWNNYACVAILCGRPEEAVAHLDILAGSVLSPVVSTLLCARLYLPSSTSRSLFQAHTSFQETALSTNRVWPPAQFAHGSRKLRIGYVSSSIREHSIIWFLLPILEHHNRNGFRIYCYSSGQHADRWTAMARAKCDAWRDIGSLSDDQAESLIRSDRIDILIDLDGHFAGNRLPLLQRKPAPILATYLGYPCTTGLREIDYRLTDSVADPKDTTDRFHTETLVRLPGPFLCFRPPSASGPLRSVRTDNEGGAVFCCFATLAKLNDELFALWRQILERSANSRLILKAAVLSDKQVRKWVQQRLSQAGIDGEQVEFWPFSSRRQDHLASFRRVDIALDTFPYNGTTGTCEALWMGVPVVTLAGNEHRSRVGSSILTAAGRAEWIAANRWQYVNKAVQLAKTIRSVRQSRAALRSDFEASPMCDAPAFVTTLEQTFHQWAVKRFQSEIGATERYTTSESEPAPRLLLEKQ